MFTKIKTLIIMQTSNSIKPFRVLMLLSISLCIYNISFGQQKTLKDITNELYLNAFIYGKTDTGLVTFLKKHVPYLTVKPPKGGWILPPRIGGTETISFETYYFKKHPLINLNSEGGMLEFEFAEYSKGDISVEDTRLKLIFKNKNDADSTYKLLFDLISPVVTKNEIEEINGVKVARFIENPADKWPKKAILILRTEEIIGPKYVIVFKDSESDEF